MLASRPVKAGPILHSLLLTAGLAAGLAVGLGFGIIGCSPAGSGNLDLGWRFADGRGCAEAGASQIVATVDGAMVGPALGWQCPNGEGTSTVQLSGAAFGGAHLVVEARSPSGTALYRGDETIADPPPPALEITLYFVGGS